MQPKVGIVILTYNRVEVLKDCLLSILESTYRNYVVIIVDNASTDGTSDVIMSQFPSARLVRSEVNLGYTGGNNLGIKYALRKENCDYVFILNDDTIVNPNSMTKLINVAETNSKIGIVNPKILDSETRSRMCKRYGKYNFYLGIGYSSLLNKNGIEEIDLMRGTSFLLKKEVIEKIGLMDENFFLYFDEADLSYRVKKAGYIIVYVPTAIVYHQILHSFSGTINPIVLYYSTRNELLFARKHLNPLIFFPLWIPRFSFRIIDYLVKFRNVILVKAILKGFYDFTKNKYGRTILPKAFVTIKAKPRDIFS